MGRGTVDKTDDGDDAGREPQVDSADVQWILFSWTVCDGFHLACKKYLKENIVHLIHFAMQDNQILKT